MRVQKQSLSCFLVFFCLAFNTISQISYSEAFPNISFNRPVEIQGSVDGTNRIFVVEHSGVIKVFPNEQEVTNEDVGIFLDIQSRVAFNAGEEIGLLGLAFHPNFNVNGFFYVYYTDRPDDFRINVVRYHVDSTDPNLADVDSATPILSFFKTGNVANSSNHNGGKITFGPDGLLYISVGDGGGAGDPSGNGQNLNSFFGSILRIDVDNPTNGKAYGIPADNPRVGIAGLDEIYAWGIRNTWKMSFDSTSGNLWGADVGQGREEEINLIEIGGNYGWNRFEGNSTYSATSLITSPDIKPVYTYGRQNGDLSITGGYVYHGIYNDINGKYIYGDYISGRVWALDPNNYTNESLFKAEGINISSFGVDELGEIYFCDYSPSGKIYNINGTDSGPRTIAVNGIGNWINADVNGIDGIVETIAVDEQGLVVGGNFNRAGNSSVSNLARYSKQNGWESLGSGTDGPIKSIAVSPSGEIFVGGDFTIINGVAASNIARWNGISWTPLSSGTNGPVSKIGIDSDGKVYVGGAFTQAGGMDVNNIALWDSGVWNPLMDGVTTIAGTNNEIRAIAFDENDNLYVGGNFSSAGGNPAGRIARWDGNSWSNLGEGTSGFVQAILVTEDHVYAGGNFTTAGSIEADRIAKWNRTNDTWEGLGQGVSGNVNTLAYDGTFLYAGGSFRTASEELNENKIMNNISRWSETLGWQAMGTLTNVGVNTVVNAMTFSDDGSELIVGGNFSTSGAIDANNIAIWSNSIECNDERVTSQFTINGSEQTIGNEVSLIVGGSFSLGIREKVDFSTTLPNGTSVEGIVSIGSTNFEDSGNYIITTTEGCIERFELIVIEDPNGDSDNDGIINSMDNCPNTPSGAATDENGCAETQLDDDNDGVSNAEDLCPGTPTTETVNLSGCGPSQLDDDNDGVSNALDICPNTPTSETADTSGCGPSQQDIDNDGISNSEDLCENTPAGEEVDDNGCSQSQLDDDNDGISNIDDVCPNTPESEVADQSGCAPSQLDDDNDGISNFDDFCNDTPIGEEVNNNGCSQSQLDDDGDGISNDLDICPNTATQAIVDNQGCVIPNISFDNFSISSIGTTCRNLFDGQLVIEANRNLNYTAQLTGVSFSETQNFNKNLAFDTLPAGTYELCLTVEEFSDFLLCNTVVIDGPEELGVLSEVDEIMGMVKLSLFGGNEYFISLNGKSYRTTSDRISLPLKPGENTLKIGTGQNCQGSYEKTILFSETNIYPNPFKTEIFVKSSHLSYKNLTLSIHNMLGQIIFQKEFRGEEIIKVDLSTKNLSNGTYFLHLQSEEINHNFKIVKQ